jgi:hypothetical protein
MATEPVPIHEGSVLIVRSGYGNDELWYRAIGQALRYGREVYIVDAHGARVRIEP